MKSIGVLAMSLPLAIFGGYTGAINWESWKDPAGKVRAHLVEFVETQLDRKITIKGETSLALYPDIGAHLSDVTISGPAGMEGQNVLSAKTLTIGVAVWPLVKGELEVDVVLDTPKISLRTDENGRRNWDISESRLGKATRKPPGRIRTGIKKISGWWEAIGLKGKTQDAKQTESEQPDFADALKVARDVRVRQFRISNGTLEMADARRNVNYTINGLTVTGMQSGVNEPFSAKGELVWRGQQVKFDFAGPSLFAFTDTAGPSVGRFNGAASTKFGRANARGVLSVGDGIAFRGRIEASSHAPARLVDWFGGHVPDTTPIMNKLDLKGDLTAGPDLAEFRGTTLQIDETTVDGNLKLDLKDYGFVRLASLDGTVSATRLPETMLAEASDLSLTFAQTEPDANLSTNGTFKFNGEHVNIAAELPPVLKAIGEADWPFKLKVTTGHGFADLDGRLAHALDEEDPIFTGSLKAETNGPRRLVKWFADPQTAALVDARLAGISSVKIDGKAYLSREKVALNSALIEVTGVRARGDLTVVDGFERKMVRGSLLVDEIDVVRVLGLDHGRRPESFETARKQRNSGPNPFLVAFGGDIDVAPGVSERPAPQREKLKPRSKADSKAARKAARLDFAWLKNADIELSLKTDKIIYRDFQSDASDIRLTAANGKLDARIDRLGVYGGRVKGKVLVTQTDEPPRINVVLGIDGVAADRLARDFGASEKLSGKAKLFLGLSGSGQDMDAVVGSLSGKGRFKLEAGAVLDRSADGRRAARLLRTIGAGNFSGSGQALHFEYDTIIGNFTAKDGTFSIASKQKMRLTGKRAFGQGFGDVNLADNTVDFSFLLRLGARKGGALSLFGKGLEIPLRMRGVLGEAKLAPKFTAVRVLTDGVSPNQQDGGIDDEESFGGFDEKVFQFLEDGKNAKSSGEKAETAN